jgi:hypothetical protein
MGSKLSFTLSEECTLRAFDNRAIRRIKLRRMRLAGQVARMGENRKAYKTSVGKLGRKRPVRRPKRRWENNMRWI